MVAVLLSPNSCHWSIAMVKNYNLNVTEIRDPDFKNAFLGIFNFTVGILIMMSPTSLSSALNQNRISFVIQVVSTFGICFVLLGHTATTKVNSSHFSDSYKLLMTHFDDT